MARGRFYYTVDTVVMGDRACQHPKGLSEVFPDRNQPCYVFTGKNRLPEDSGACFMNQEVESFLKSLDEQYCRIRLFGGADLIDTFMKRI